MRLDIDVLSSTSNLSDVSTDPDFRVAQSDGSGRHIALLVAVASLYMLAALAWSATGRGDLEHAEAAAIAAAAGGALTLALAVLMSSIRWPDRRRRSAYAQVVLASGAMAGSAIAACYVVLSKSTVVWKPAALSWAESTALALLFVSCLLLMGSGRLSERRIEIAVESLVCGLSISSGVLLLLLWAVPTTATPASSLATILGLAAGVALLSMVARVPGGLRRLPGLPLALVPVAIVWSSSLVIEDFGRDTASAGWLAFGRFLLPLASFGIAIGLLDPFLKLPIHNFVHGRPAKAWGPIIWLFPAATAVTALVAWSRDVATWSAPLLCSILAAVLLVARQTWSLRLERRRVIELLDLSAELERVANIDKVTGIPNRTALDARLEQELERAIRYRQPVCICCVDIDHFKHVNDTHGHATGDDALRAIAESLRLTGRAIDFVARAGGEEFVVIAPGTWSADALVFGERLRQHVESLRLVSRRSEPLQLTISVGVAGYPEHADSASLLLERADEALYASKKRGRNRVTLWQPDVRE